MAVAQTRVERAFQPFSLRRRGIVVANPDRGPANLVINSVDAPQSAAPGDNVLITVSVTDTSGSAAPGEEFNQGWIYADSPNLSQPLMRDCFIISPGATEVRAGSTISGTLAGQFTMPETAVSISVTAGGLSEGTHCSNAQAQGQTTDSTSVTVGVAGGGGGGDSPEPAPGNGAGPEPGQIVVESIETTPTAPQVGDRVTITVRARNEGGQSTVRSFNVAAGTQLLGEVNFGLGPGASDTAQVTWVPTATGPIPLQVGAASRSVTVAGTPGGGNGEPEPQPQEPPSEGGGGAEPEEPGTEPPATGQPDQDRQLGAGIAIGGAALTIVLLLAS